MATYDITGDAVEPPMLAYQVEFYYSYTVSRTEAFAADSVLDFGATAAPGVSEQGPIQHWS